MVGKKTTVELYARSPLPGVVAERRETVADRLSSLSDRGRLAAFDVATWQPKVPLAGDEPEVELFDRFSEWAEGAGVGLEPFFETRTCYSMETGEVGERLVLPVLCLGIYRDDRLASVYPHAADGETRSVMDGLRALESGTVRARSPENASARPVRGASD